MVEGDEATEFCVGEVAAFSSAMASDFWWSVSAAASIENNQDMDMRVSTVFQFSLKSNGLELIVSGLSGYRRKIPRNCARGGLSGLSLKTEANRAAIAGM